MTKLYKQLLSVCFLLMFSCLGYGADVTSIDYTIKDGNSVGVTFTLSGATKYQTKYLKASGIYPPRVYLDFLSSDILPYIPNSIDFNVESITKIRWSYHNKTTPRVVFELNSLYKNYKTIVSRDSKSITLIFYTDRTERALLNNNQASSVFASVDNKKKVVIDPGHGGKDPGATYFGYKEKDIVLNIANKLKNNYRKDDITYYYTRNTDIFIPLKERAKIANERNADIFISIHANAAKSSSVNGLTSYVLNTARDKTSIDTAALENAAATKEMSDLAKILQNILVSSKLEESLSLANTIQRNILNQFNSNQLNSFGVRQAPFYVLVGAKMPAVLIETAFLSNRRDSKILGSKQKEFAEGIHSAIVEYLKTIEY